jgi:hypothetical protein
MIALLQDRQLCLARRVVDDGLGDVLRSEYPNEVEAAVRCAWPWFLPLPTQAHPVLKARQELHEVAKAAMYPPYDPELSIKPVSAQTLIRTG